MNRRILPEHSRWKRAAVCSLLFHGMLFGLLAFLLPSYFEIQKAPPIEVSLTAGQGGRGHGTASNSGVSAAAPLKAKTEPSDVSSPNQHTEGGLSSSSGRGTESAEGYGNGTSGTGEGMAGGGGGTENGEEQQPAAIEGPKLLSAPSPRYPESARREQKEGTAVIGLTIAEDGSVTQTWVESSSGDSRLDSAAAEAVYAWQFVPARRNGVPISARSRVPVIFELLE